MIYPNLYAKMVKVFDILETFLQQDLTFIS